ncbi:hypothetical protein RN001_004082 [Aquatica leii]|uniref:SCP domain-containing protein n=1 Tax=Aquatica leii TaxID=1421715 RepID=A0AAN7PRU1_9COLE|nr:hypothetical protein RN001_004082 [Aquatica leii]
MFKVLLGFFYFGVVSGFLYKNPYCELSCDAGNGRLHQHTVCQRANYKCLPDASCGPDFKIVKLTDAQRQLILNVHNKFRCKVALGKETRGKQPAAKNMRIMSYDRELEFIAQCWANACNGASLIHDACRRTRKHEHVGQNLGYISSSANNINVTEATLQLIDYWYDEVAIFNNQWVLDTRDRGFKVGHYTQMVWADTHRLGCAAIQYTTKQFDGNKWYEFLLVCNYAPGGNYIGMPVYKPGPSGSACPDKLKQNICGLCGRFVNVTEQEYFQPFFKF